MRKYIKYSPKEGSNEKPWVILSKSGKVIGRYMTKPAAIKAWPKVMKRVHTFKEENETDFLYSVEKLKETLNNFLKNVRSRNDYDNEKTNRILQNILLNSLTKEEYKELVKQMQIWVN